MRYRLGIRYRQLETVDTWEQAWQLFEEQTALALDEAAESDQVASDVLARLRAEHAALFRADVGEALGRNALYLFGVHGAYHYVCPDSAEWDWV